MPGKGRSVPRCPQPITLEARPALCRKEPLPRATTTSGVRSLVEGKAMSKGRSEAAAGGNSRGRWETGRRVGRGRLKDPLPALSLLSLRDPAEVPTGAEPALQCPGRIREPAAGTWAGQDGENTLLGPWDPRGSAPPGCRFSPGLPKACRALPSSLVTSFRLPKSLS